MSVFNQLVETIKRSSKREHFADLTLQTERSSGLLPELKKVRIQSPNGVNFVVYFVVESEDDRSDGLIASLAGFYNARYILEYLKHGEIKAPVGHFNFFVRKLLEGGANRSFVALSLQWNQTSRSTKSQISLEDLEKVAETLAVLHSCGFDRPRASYRQVINENHEDIQHYLTAVFRQQAPHLIDSLFSKHSRNFANAKRTRSIVEELLGSFHSFQIPVEESSRTTVLCHGNLCLQNLEFDENGNLHAITNWEHAHFGHVAEDLSYLMLSGLAAEERRSNYLRILRHYFYRLVDVHCVAFKLYHLKQFYHRFLKHAALFRLLTLEAEIDEDESSAKFVIQRWENTVIDAQEFENDFVSDGEDPLTFQHE
ncbi:CHK domain-containing protein [Aphelenchoides besseyi]|nr:CHK domain-containing protein [Aphelenchoides besseyi]